MIYIGNFGPDFGLRDQHGSLRALYSQEIAGVCKALFFIEDAGEAVLAEAIGRIRGTFRAPVARPIAITPAPPSASMNLIRSVT